MKLNVRRSSFGPPTWRAQVRIAVVPALQPLREPVSFSATFTRFGVNGTWVRHPDDAGYFDQPHLTRSLKRLIGQTPAELLRVGSEELSFLYKTDLFGPP